MTCALIHYWIYELCEELKFRSNNLHVRYENSYCYLTIEKRDEICLFLPKTLEWNAPNLHKHEQNLNRTVQIEMSQYCLCNSLHSKWKYSQDFHWAPIWKILTISIKTLSNYVFLWIRVFLTCGICVRVPCMNYLCFEWNSHSFSFIIVKFQLPFKLLSISQKKSIHFD